MKTPFHFLSLYFGIFSVFIGDQILMFAVPLLVFKKTQSLAYSGIAYFIEWLPRVLCLPYSGMLTDKFGPKRMLLATDLIKALACFLAFFFMQAEMVELAVTLGVLAAITSIGNAQTLVAADTLLTSHYTGEQYTMKEARLMTADQISMLVGPAFAAGLAFAFPLPMLLLGAAVFYLLNYVNILVAFQGEVEVRPIAPTSESFSLRVGFSILKQHPLLIGFCIIGTLNNLLIGLVEASAPATITHHMSLPDAYFSLLNMVSGCCGAISLFLVPKALRCLSLRQLGIFSFIGICIASIWVNNTLAFWPFISAFASLIACTLLSSVYTRSIRATVISQEHMGRVIGLMSALNQVSLPFVGIILGLGKDVRVIQQIGTVFSFILCVVGIFVFWRLPEKKPLLAPAPQE